MEQIFTGRIPFWDVKSEYEVIKRVINGVHNRPSGGNVAARGLDDRMWALMLDCWTMEPPERPTISAVFDRLCVSLHSPNPLQLESVYEETEEDIRIRFDSEIDESDLSSQDSDDYVLVPQGLAADHCGVLEKRKRDKDDSGSFRTSRFSRVTSSPWSSGL